MPEAETALLFIRPLRELGLRYAVTGSVASIVYGEPRLTHDLDAVLLLRLDQITDLVKAFPPEEFYCPPAEVIAYEAGREHRGHINIIHIPTGFKVDLYFAGRDPLHEWALRDARELRIAGESVRVAPPEYVILRKLEFYREGGSEKHLRDIRMMLKMSGPQIDTRQLEQLVAERGLRDVWAKVTNTQL